MNRAYASIDRVGLVWSRVTRLARPGSKYKYVILAGAKGACVTEHLPRGAWPPFVPQRAHRLKRRVL